MSKGLVLECCWLSYAMAIADLLSEYNLIGHLSGWKTSLMKWCSHNASLVAWVNAMNSALLKIMQLYFVSDNSMRCFHHWFGRCRLKLNAYGLVMPSQHQHSQWGHRDCSQGITYSSLFPLDTSSLFSLLSNVLLPNFWGIVKAMILQKQYHVV